MDHKKEKRLRNIRVAITNIFMSICVVAIVFVLVLIAMGFTIDESGRLVQSGLIQLSSHPTDANVLIDNETKFGHTNFSKSIASGTHTINISKDGFDTWERELRVDAGLLTRVEWIRLFPNNPEISEATRYSNVRFTTFSPNRKLLILATEKSNTLQKISIQDDDFKTTELKLSDCFNTTAEEITHGTISFITWNDDNSRAIAKWTTDTGTTWHLVDLNHTEKSINLSKKYSLNFSDILIANDSASKLWAIENSNLRLIEVNNQTVSSAVADQVLSFKNNRDVVAFFRKQSNQENTLNLYREGENGYTEIDHFSTVDDTVYTLSMGSCWNEQWLAYNIDNKFVVLSGKYPAYEKNKNSSLQTIADLKLDYKPTQIVTNRNNRVVIAGGEKGFTSYDIETKDSYDTDLTIAPSLNWIDDYLFWQNINDKIIVRDWDGNNRRTIIGNAESTLPVSINDNNRWLYFFTKDNEKSDELTTTVILKREKLY